ncbi:MAG: class I SAM-dependent methyltransferase [Mycobacterium sp.]
MARTDGDSWDLASSVGATATMVAGQRALAHREQLIDDPFAEPLVRAVGLDFFTKALDGELKLEDVDPNFTPRRAAEGMTVRTRFFDQVFTDAAAAGVRQAVILASGLDARAYRLNWPAGTVVYEIDQPEVIAFKTQTLAELGAAPTTDRRTVSIDLREDWITALKDNGFDPSAPTAWIAEGLLIYLPPEAQDKLFDNITALSAPGSFVACEQIGDMSTFDDDKHKLMSERMKALGSNIEMTDLIYQGDRNHVVDYLDDHGWDVTAISMADAYAANAFEFPDDEMSRAFGDLKYVRAVLTQQG